MIQVKDGLVYDPISSSGGGAGQTGIPGMNNVIDPHLKDEVLPNGRLGLLAKGGFGGLLGRAGNALSMGAYSAKRQMIDKAKTLPKSAGRLIRKGAVGALGGGTAAMLAAGIAATTGDPSKAATMMAAAGAAGANFTNYYGDKLGKGAGSAAALARTGFWGGDQKKVNQYKFDQEFLKSPALMSSLTSALGSPEAAKEAIKNKEVQALLNANITDPGKIAKALKLKKEYIDKGRYKDNDKALQHAVAMAQWNRDVNPGVFNTFSRENSAFRDNLFKSLQAQGHNNPSAINQEIDRIMEDLIYFEK